jgi:hypothetical protein
MHGCVLPHSSQVFFTRVFFLVLFFAMPAHYIENIILHCNKKLV